MQAISLPENLFEKNSQQRMFTENFAVPLVAISVLIKSIKPDLRYISKNTFLLQNIIAENKKKFIKKNCGYT